jgi:hypothetical protein
VKFIRSLRQVGESSFESGEFLLSLSDGYVTFTKFGYVILRRSSGFMLTDMFGEWEEFIIVLIGIPVVVESSFTGGRRRGRGRMAGSGDCMCARDTIVTVVAGNDGVTASTDGSTQNRDTSSSSDIARHIIGIKRVKGKSKKN